MKKLILFLVFICYPWIIFAIRTDATIESASIFSDGEKISNIILKTNHSLNESPEYDISNNGRQLNFVVHGAHLPTIGIPGIKINNFNKYNIKFNAKQISASDVSLSWEFKEVINKNDIALTLKDNGVVISLGALKLKSNEVVSTPIEKQNVESLDETYLTKIEKKINDEKVVVAPKKEILNLSHETVQPKKDNFNLSSYVGKLVLFLGLMTLGFYVVLSLIKKGVIKKSTLGFLNSTNMVEVLNTTHLAPKKALYLVKAHNQVFLISSTESSMNLISEIKDVAGLIKNSEANITGNNFDMNFDDEKFSDKEFKLKEINNLQSDVVVKEKITFSDQIKGKLKGYKEL